MTGKRHTRGGGANQGEQVPFEANRAEEPLEGTTDEPRGAETCRISAHAWLQTVVDGFGAGLAYISDRPWNMRVFNAIADEVYGFSSSPEPNLLVRMLLEPQLRDLHEHWEGSRGKWS